MVTGALTMAENMGPSNEISGKTEILHDVEEIADLSIIEERIIETEDRIANLEDRETIIGRNRIVVIRRGIGEKETELRDYRRG